MSSSAPGRVEPVGQPVRRAGRVVALGFGVIALAGFLPGLTAHLEQLDPAGWGSGALLFGVVRVSAIGNLIHATMAGAGLMAARSDEASRRYLLWGGAGYAALSCHRLLVDHLAAGGMVPGRGVGEWLPIAAGLAMVVTAIVTTAGTSPQRTR